MKLMLVFALTAVIVSSCLAAPAGTSADVEIVSSEFENNIDGGYKFSYELSDGTTRTEEATVNNPGAENESLTIRGSVSWIAPDGQRYTITFVADENGFHPEGAHIPK